MIDGSSPTMTTATSDGKDKDERAEERENGSNQAKGERLEVNKKRE